MTYEMEYLMHLYACGAAGRPAEAPSEAVDWERLISLAVGQSITYTVAMAVKKSQTGCPEAVKRRLLSSLMGASYANKIKTAGILELLSRLEQSGIHAVLLKGIDAARFYVNPECRVSADTDILISRKDEAAATELLRQSGFTITKRAKKVHHDVCTHPALGMIELHVDMWEDEIDDVIFGKSGIAGSLTEPHRAVETEDGKYYALGRTDALLFLTLHMVKHFLTGGMSLRMMMDTSLYFRHEKDGIDADRYWNAMRSLKLDTFMNVVFGAMIKHCGFDIKDFPGAGECSDDNIAAVLDDLELGGWQGKINEKDRKDGWYYLKRQRRISEAGAVKSAVLIKSDILMDKLYALFPPVSHMQKSYPGLKKSRLLYPFCWIHRALFKGIRASAAGKTKSRKNIQSKDKLAQEGRERLDMFSKLGMI